MSAKATVHTSIELPRGHHERCILISKRTGRSLSGVFAEAVAGLLNELDEEVAAGITTRHEAGLPEVAP